MTPDDFAYLFRRYVGPRIERRCRTEGALVALGLRPFNSAYAKVIRAAIDRGAAHLSSELLTDLEQHVAASIIAAAASCDPMIEQAEQLAANAASRATQL